MDNQETKLCKHCQTEIPKKAKVCPQCRRKQGGKAKWIIIIIAVLFIFSMLFGDDDSSYTLSDDATTLTREEYIDKCEDVSYEELARTNSQYVGTKVKFIGEIFQVVYSSDTGSSTYLISVTEDEYGLWDDHVYVRFDTSELESKFLEDDIVVFYGEVSGEYSYESILGQSITIPSVTAVYMEIQE